MARALAMLVDAREPVALNYCRAFREAGHDVTLVNRGPQPAADDRGVRDLAKPSDVVDLYPPSQPRRDRELFLLNAGGDYAAAAGLGGVARPLLMRWLDARLVRAVQERLVGVVEGSGAEVVYGFWGIGPLPEFRALQRAKAPQALVHQFQTYPLTRARAARPVPVSPVEREVLGRLDARLHASAEMEDYVHRAMRPLRGLDQALPDAWGRWASPKERLPRLSDRDGAPHVAHVGTAPHEPGTFDDVRAELQAIAAEGVRVHAVEGFPGEGLQHFPRQGLRALLDGRFASFLTQFDAVLCTYAAPQGLAWFHGNMPARFLSGVGAGVPVAVPRGLFGAVQAFVERHGNGVVYGSPAELAAWLRDPEKVAKARSLAMALAREHVLDRFVHRYQDALEMALDLRGGRPPGGAATLK